MCTNRLLNQLNSLNKTSVQITTNFAFNHKNIEMYRFIEIIQKGFNMYANQT